MDNDTIIAASTTMLSDPDPSGNIKEFTQMMVILEPKLTLFTSGGQILS